jgi:hypothetical protein
LSLPHRRGVCRGAGRRAESPGCERKTWTATATGGPTRKEGETIDTIDTIDTAEFKSASEVVSMVTLASTPSTPGIDTKGKSHSPGAVAPADSSIRPTPRSWTLAGRSSSRP